MTTTEKAQDRLIVLEKIAKYEKNGDFDKEVEADDFPFEILKPNDVDFLNKKFSSKIKTLVANIVAKKFCNKMLKEKQVIFSGVTGLENLKGFRGGAMVTCNHCHMLDHYAIYMGLKKHFKSKFKLYKIIKESNYSMPGKFGFFMKNCDTIPLSQNLRTMVKCMDAVKTLLENGKKVLIYPEQNMWWNYKKPRPLKSGAFRFSAKFNVPIIPCFLTMEDSDIIGKDGFVVQKFTLHILPLIYPDKNLPVNENCENMKNKNSQLWKDLYESVYGK